MVGDSIHQGRGVTSHYPHCVGMRQLGILPLADVIQNLGLSVLSTSGGDNQPDSGVGSLASIIPFLMSLPLGGRREGEEGYQAVLLLGREGPPYSPNETC